MSAKITIGITDCGKWANYDKWIRQDNPDIEVIKLTWKENNFEDIDRCDGIILSGGEDVHPRFYNKKEYYSLLDPKDIKEERDAFELKVIETGLEKRKPILGICRGLQIANVYLKGTLIPDIPTTGLLGHGMSDNNDGIHLIKVEENSLLKSITENETGTINSAHHQSADVVADSLKINSYSDNGIIEGLEWKDSSDKPFLLLVQWHPERMPDASTSPFSKNIRSAFLKEAGLETF